MSESNYPRMLFRGDETSRADSRDELLAKREQGWQAKLLPGETPEDIGEVTVYPERTPLPGDAPVALPKRGRPAKSAE